MRLNASERVLRELKHSREKRSPRLLSNSKAIGKASFAGRDDWARIAFMLFYLFGGMTLLLALVTKLLLVGLEAGLIFICFSFLIHVN